MCTFLVGLLVFMIGQCFLKLALEPVVSFKEALGELSAFCLKNRATITNASACPEKQEELRHIISMILSKKEAIFMYGRFHSLVLKLPKDKDVIDACQILNSIAYDIVNRTEFNEAKSKSENICDIDKGLKEVSDLLKVRIDYEK